MSPHCTEGTLDSLLVEWHAWMAGAPVNGVDRMASPMFRDIRSGRYWEQQDRDGEQQSHKARMKAVDFQISGDSRGQGGLPEPHRSAIYCLARNLHAGVSVWRHPRLPSDPEELAIVLLEARNALTRRLFAAGVI